MAVLSLLAGGCSDEAKKAGVGIQPHSGFAEYRG